MALLFDSGEGGTPRENRDGGHYYGYMLEAQRAIPPLGTVRTPLRRCILLAVRLKSFLDLRLDILRRIRGTSGLGSIPS